MISIIFHSVLKHDPTDKKQTLKFVNHVTIGRNCIIVVGTLNVSFNVN